MPLEGRIEPADPPGGRPPPAFAALDAGVMSLAVISILGRGWPMRRDAS